MKIKIVRRVLNVSQINPPSVEPTEVYDVYHGFNSIPPLPFCTKWMIDKAGLCEQEMIDYMRPYLSTCGNYKIKVVNGGVMR